MIKRLIAIGFIFGCTSIAWFVLAGITSNRTDSADRGLRQQVERVWGAPQFQPPPSVSWTERVTRKAEWPDWYPPDDMRKRDRTLPKRVPGGPNNPMGARAIYLGTTLYRIHGSNEVETIGQSISSGCFRMRNEDVIELYKAVTIGMKVTVRR